MNGGDHFLLDIKREYFPLLNLKFGNATEIATTKIWRSNNGEHSEIALIGTKSCLIERGKGYRSIRGLEYEEMLTREELVDMLAGCEAFQTEWKVISECIKILSPYWKQPDRDEIVYAISGWWHKDSDIPQKFAEQFFEFLIMTSPIQDEDLVKTLSVIKRSYAMNKSDVIGRSKLDEIFGGKSVRSKLKRELEKLGYAFKDAESAECRTDEQEKRKAVENTTFVEDLIKEFHIKTLEDTREFYRYDKGMGIYIGNAEPFIKSTIAHRFRNLEIKVSVKMMNQFINEIEWFSYFDRRNFNKEIEWLACVNCMINLKTLETAEFSPDFLCTTRIPVKYYSYPYEDEYVNNFFRLVEGTSYDGILSHAPRIKKFLNDLFFPEDIEKVLDYLAYCLWRDYEFNFWLLLNGGGLNGKSLFFNIIATLFGSENVSGETLQRLSDPNNRFAVAGLFGKLINIDADISQETVFKNTGKIKKLTGNDLIIGENKFKNPFKFKNCAKLFFSVNRIPTTYDDSDAFYRRIIIVNLRQQYMGGKMDIHLFKKITTEEELSGLLYELVRRVPKILTNGLMKVTPEAIRETQVKLTIDLIDYFYQKVVVHHPGDNTKLVSKLEMHEEYCKFAAYYRLTPESEAALSRRLSGQKYGMRYDKHTINHERLYAWERVSLRIDWMKMGESHI